MDKARLEGITPPKDAYPTHTRDGTAWRCHIPEDGVVLSPHIEIFRGSTFAGYPFLSQAVTLVAVVSVAMPNCNPRMRDAPIDKPSTDQSYQETLVRKFAAIFEAAKLVGATTIIMPDAGCGVYMNSPTDVGAAMGRALRTRNFCE